MIDAHYERWMWVVSLVVAENLGMFGFDTFETLNSKHETAREVGTFKNARVAAQDVEKPLLPGKRSGVNPYNQLLTGVLPATPTYARAPASGPSP